MNQQPLVGVIMGSTSDWETMKHATETLEEFGVPYEAKVVSAHRTPDLMADYAKTAVSRNLYAWQKQGTFTYTVYADTILSLRDHLAQTWNDAIIDDEVIRRTLELMQTPNPDQEVILREVIKIPRLKPVNSVQ